MKTVFLDTVGLVALWHETDQWHASALACYKQIVQQRVRAISTPQVLFECGNALARSSFRNRLTRLRQHLEQTGAIIPPTDEEVSRAWRIFDKGQAGEPGIVDLISFQIMQRLQITDAFTNDQHFRAAGLKTLF